MCQNEEKRYQIQGEDLFFFFRKHYVFTTLSQIYLGRRHLCKSLFLAILGLRKKALRNTALNEDLFLIFD